MEENKNIGNQGKEFITDPEIGVSLLKGEAPKEVEPQEYKPSPMWEGLKTAIGENFKMPEGITKENEMEMFSKALKEFKNENIELSGTAKEIYELAKKGEFNEEKYFEEKLANKKLMSMPSKEFMAEVLKRQNGFSEENKNGWSDEDISQFLEGKSKIELDMMASQEKAKLKQTTKKEEPNKPDEPQPINDDYINNIIKLNEDKETIKNIFNETFNKTEFDKKFNEYAKIDPKTKTNKIAEMINDDNTLYEMVAAFEYVKNNIKLKKELESKSKDIDSKTGKKPFSSAQTGLPDNSQQDVNLLM